jgi:hypothetical protein
LVDFSFLLGIDSREDGHDRIAGGDRLESWLDDGSANSGSVRISDQ